MTEPKLAPARQNRAWRVRRLLLTDLCAMVLALGLAWLLRWQIPSDTLYLPIEVYIPVAMLLCALLVGLFIRARLYSSAATPSLSAELFAVAGQVTLAVALFIAAAFWVRDLSLSRLLVGFTWVLLLGSLMAGRLLVRAIEAGERRRGVGLRQVWLLGRAGTDKPVLEHYQTASERQDVRITTHPLDWARLEQGVSEGQVDEVVLHAGEVTEGDIFRWGSILARSQVSLKVVPPGANLALLPVAVDPSSSVLLLEVGQGLLDPASQLAKRVLDLTLACFLLPLGLLIGAMVALLVVMTSPGAPVLFWQERLGRGGRPIRIVKFRTMVPNAEALLQEDPALRAQFEAEYKLTNDPRQTPVGRFLRKTSLDELPQLWNILIGELSFVGPRPIVPPELAKYGEYGDLLLAVMPGLTGMWQVSGRSDVSYAERIQLDMLYIERWSIALDLKILTLTIPAVLSRRGAG